MPSSVRDGRREILRIIHFDVDHRDLVSVRRKILQDLFSTKAFDNLPGPTMPRTVQLWFASSRTSPTFSFRCWAKLSSMMMSSGILKGPPSSIIETATHFVEAVQVDPGDAFQSADAVQNNALRQRDMRLLLDERDILLGHRSAGHTDQRRSRRTDQNVSSDTSGSRLTGLDHAAAQADNGQDQSDLQTDGKNCKESSKWAVLQILNYEFRNQVPIVRSLPVQSPEVPKETVTPGK